MVQWQGDGTGGGDAEVFMWARRQLDFPTPAENWAGGRAHAGGPAVEKLGVQ